MLDAEQDDFMNRFERWIKLFGQRVGVVAKSDTDVASADMFSVTFKRPPDALAKGTILGWVER